MSKLNRLHISEADRMKIKPLEIDKDVFWVGMYLKYAKITVNPYLILGEAPTLIDTGPEIVATEIAEKINELVKPEKIRYIAISHEHPDHIGALPLMLTFAYNANVLTERRNRVFLYFLGIVGHMIDVKDREAVKLGSKKLTFFKFPVETVSAMVAFLEPQGILFTQDIFGSVSLTDSDFKVIVGDNEKELEKTIRQIEIFHNELEFDKDLLKSYLKRTINLIGGIDKIRLIAPGHGSIIKGKNNIKKLFEYFLSQD